MTPQEKKSLSYKLDCRNTFGENNKSSRKNIPLRRARKHRHNRRAVKQVIVGAAEFLDVQDNVAGIDLDRWQKGSDIPLAQHIKGQVAKRVASGQQPA